MSEYTRKELELIKKYKELVENEGIRVSPSSKFFIYDGRIWEAIMEELPKMSWSWFDNVAGYLEITDTQRRNMVINKYCRCRSFTPIQIIEFYRTLKLNYKEKSEDTKEKISRFDLMDLE